MKAGLTVGAVARLAQVSVRTLHHYDQVGLLTPEERTDSGYRIYGTTDIERLQEILFFRELGFGLTDISEMMARPDYDRRSALERQRTMLENRTERLLNMVDAIEQAIEANRKGIRMTHEEMLEVFDGFDPAEYEEESKERWGDSAAHQQSARQTAQYTKGDWLEMKAEAGEINDAFLALMASGTSSESAQAGEVVDRHREHISKWFYDCSVEIHAGLGQMYVADQRFNDNIDKAGKGLAQYMSDAIAARYEA